MVYGVSMKAFLDFLPLIVFFAVFKLYGIMPATAALVVATLISTLALYIKDKKVAVMPLVSAGLVAVFGIATLLADDPLFIKLKPTILYVIMGAILMIGVIFFKKGLIEYLLGNALELPQKAWRILSMRWGIFFMAMAVLNELLWRNLSTDTWVNFKVFGFFPIILVFALAQAPFIMKWQKEKASDTVNEDSAS